MNNSEASVDIKAELITEKIPKKSFEDLFEFEDSNQLIEVSPRPENAHSSGLNTPRKISET